MNKYLVPAVVAIVVLGGGLFLYSVANNSAPVSPVPAPTPAPVPAPVTTPTPQPVPPSSSIKLIQMLDNKYVPMDVTIKQNDSVNFLNLGKSSHWPASNIHPTHQIYPEFDPKRPIAPGESWMFTFTKVGVWRWHDHLYPEIHGTITVTQ